MTTHRFFHRLVSCIVIFVSIVGSSMRAPSVRAAVPTSGVVIGEVSWAGSSLSTADEWLELWNMDDAAVSLAGWSLRGASAEQLPFPADAIIQPHSVYLVSNYAADDEKTVLATTTHLVTTAVALSNSVLKIELLDASGNVVDTVGTGGTPSAGASLPVKTTMIRADEWTSATTTQNMKPNIPDLGTPGICDHCGIAEIIPELVPDPVTPDPEPDPLPPPEPTATSTTPTPEDPIEITTTTEELIEETVAEEPSEPLQTTAYSLPSPPPPIPKPNYNMLRLNEVAPYPGSGKEWIEIATLDASQAINLKGCTLNDATGKIFTIGDTTIDPAISRYVTVTLSTAKLNNSGDGVSLYAPDGRLLDVMTYETTKKDETWIRYPDLIGNWQKTTSPTPAFANLLALPVTATSTKAITTTKTTTTKAVTTKTSSTTDVIPKSILDALNNEVLPEEPTDPDAFDFEKMDGEDLLAADELEADIFDDVPTTKKKAATKSTATVKPIYPISFDMLTQENLSDVRVRLTGRVGTLPGLVAAHKFVLQNPDGRGLLVTIPTKQRLPAFGSDVTVVGSLTLDDKGVASLKIGAKDPWSRVPTSTERVEPRIVDLLLPSPEDAWSFANVTGTVTDVKSSSVRLDLGDTELDVVIKPLVKYRVQRLAVGDVITVTGLLDLTKDDPKLLPRFAKEIVLVSHAPPKVAAIAPPTAQGPTLPGWAPFGAAGGAVVVTEGVKRLHRRRKMKKLDLPLPPPLAR